MTTTEKLISEAAKCCKEISITPGLWPVVEAEYPGRCGDMVIDDLRERAEAEARSVTLRKLQGILVDHPGYISRSLSDSRSKWLENNYALYLKEKVKPGEGMIIRVEQTNKLLWQNQ